MKRVPQVFSKLYYFFFRLPDRLYPFKAEIEGEWVRGRRAYEAALAAAFTKYGHARYGVPLAAYRSIFHALGSVAIIATAILLSRDFSDSQRVVTIVLASMIVLIGYQEFYAHRALQSRRKALVDWLVWSVPMGLYLLIR